MKVFGNIFLSLIFLTESCRPQVTFPDQTTTTLLTTVATTRPPSTPPPATQPPTTLPPTTQPPTTLPPATQPPTTLPPATQPPTTLPPATQPPTTAASTVPLATTLRRATSLLPPMTPSTQQVCQCVTTANCEIAGGISPDDGDGKIEYRIQQNYNPNITNPTGTMENQTFPASPGLLIVQNQTSCDRRLDMCCSPLGYQCGLRYPAVMGASNISDWRAPHGAYPSIAMVLTNSSNQLLLTASLIDHQHLITTADKLYKLTDFSDLTVRLGERLFKVAEVLPPRDFNISRIFIHPKFNIKNSKNNVAIIRLSSVVNLGEFPSIGTGCLPSSPISGLRCWLAGWSRGAGVKIEHLRHIDVPLINATTCQDQLRKTVLGPKYVLDRESFICAGGEKGSDACAGDGGSPLMCEVAGRLYITGMVAWGIDGCGKENIPGVYMNVQSYVPWIQETIKSVSSPNLQAAKPTVKKSIVATTKKMVQNAAQANKNVG